MVDTKTLIEILILFTITSLSSTLGTLKHIFINKKQLKPAYVLTFVDAIMYGTIMKQVSSGTGIYFITTFALGKLFGTWLGDYLDNKIALGIIEVEMFVNHKDTMKQIADDLRERGYSTETDVRYGYMGKKRYVINITIKRKELHIIKQVAEQHGYTEPTIRIRDISKVTGKFNTPQ